MNVVRETSNQGAGMAMATANSIDEARNWNIDGMAIDLVAIHGTETLSSVAARGLAKPDSIESLSVGQQVVALVRGDMRNGVISKIGRKKVSVTYITAGAIKEIDRIGYGTISTSMVEIKYIWA